MDFLVMSTPRKEDDNSSVYAIGFTSSPEPISPDSSFLSIGTEASSLCVIGFSDTDLSSLVTKTNGT